MGLWDPCGPVWILRALRSSGECAEFLCSALRSLHTKSEIFAFFVFLILSYQNACYGIEPDPNFFMTDESFGGQCVNVIDTT